MIFHAFSWEAWGLGEAWAKLQWVTASFESGSVILTGGDWVCFGLTSLCLGPCLCFCWVLATSTGVGHQYYFFHRRPPRVVGGLCFWGFTGCDPGFGLSGLLALGV